LQTCPSAVHVVAAGSCPTGDSRTAKVVLALLWQFFGDVLENQAFAPTYLFWEIIDFPA
jgi:hypothetical protein